mmetsp:Transcript_109/g.514  ORF Transcript_109/g.514 Transcript_109/m.514 type:complete len:657 (-) Transcript_109:452-2422(-)
MIQAPNSYVGPNALVLEERMESPAGPSPSRSPTTKKRKAMLIKVPDASELQPLDESTLTCIEDGRTFNDLESLQVHMKMKTAWSNTSLLGCRICALVDNLEWHEGTVRSYHRSSGKHLVEFEARGEARWMRMTRTAFYVMRPSRWKEQETKELDAVDSGLHRFDSYDYVEDISESFCLAQSRLYHIYGCRTQETGHKTSGHLCITSNDKDKASASGSCLLYGELLPRGVNKALGPNRLRAKARSVLIDLGMGTGKICVQAFLQYPNLKHVHGVELAESRYRIAENAARSMVSLFPNEFDIILHEPKRVVVATKDKSRRLEFELGSMFDCPYVEAADIVLLETDVLSTCHEETCKMLRRMHPQAMLLSYLDLEMMWNSDDFPFVQHRENRDLTDRYPTSWSVSRGHHFYLWMRVAEGRAYPLAVRTSRQALAAEGTVSSADSSSACCLPFLRCFRRAQTREVAEAEPAPLVAKPTHPDRLGGNAQVANRDGPPTGDSSSGGGGSSSSSSSSGGSGSRGSNGSSRSRGSLPAAHDSITPDAAVEDGQLESQVTGAGVTTSQSVSAASDNALDSRTSVVRSGLPGGEVKELVKSTRSMSIQRAGSLTSDRKNGLLANDGQHPVSEAQSAEGEISTGVAQVVHVQRRSIEPSATAYPALE